MSNKIIDLELTEKLVPIWGIEKFDGVCIFVRYEGIPVGWVYIDGIRQPVLSVERLREAIVEQLGWEIVPAVLGKHISNGATDNGPLVPISVIVCSRERSNRLERCLQTLLTLDYPDYEIIVVGDTSRSSDTDPPAEKVSIRYFREAQPGMASARNRGIAEARHDIIAFTNDRGRPDRQWLRAIDRSFAEPEVIAVTGLVAPAELATEEQVRLEFNYGTNRVLQPRTLRRDKLSVRELLWARTFGSGSNMAFRRQLFASIGQFDDSFDLSSHSNNSSDIEMLHRLIAGGYTLAYEPSALVWFTHKSNGASHRWIYDKGISFGAYLLTCSRNRTVNRLSIFWFALYNWMGSLIKNLLRPGKLSRRLIVFEMIGALISPFAYRKARMNARSVNAMPAKLQDQSDIKLDPRAVVEQNSYRFNHGGQKSDKCTRVVVIRTWYPHWGSYSGMNQFLRHINKDKYNVLMHIAQENDNDFPVRNEAVRRWFRRRVQRPDMPWYNLSDLTAEIKTLRHYCHERADIIHFLDGEHSAQFLPRLCKLPSKIRPKIVVTYHQPAEVLDSVIRKDNIARLDCITVVSPEQVEFFRTLIEDDKIYLILHGIDTNHFKPASRRTNDGAFRCIAVGHNYRDYNTVKDVAEALRSERNIEFHVVSPRPTGLEDLPNVKVYKGIDDAQLLNLYQQSDLLFLPLLKATANNTLLEGAACGLPILSTCLPSVKTYLPGNEAILVKDNDPQEFAEAILHLAANPHLRKTMSTCARKRAEELNWQNIAPQYEEIYSKLES